MRSNTPKSILTGMGGSPASKAKQIYKNIQRRFLFLTDIRSSQHENKERLLAIIKQKKQMMIGKTFSVRPEPPKYCRKNPLAILDFDEKGEIVKVTLSRINCNSWTCPRCNLLKALKVKYLIKETAILNNLGYFLTLTLDPAKIPTFYLSDNRNNTHEYITKLFNVFVTDLKRNINTQEKLKYIWVMEFQKNGNAHLHILLNKYIDINLVREIWVRVGGGHIMRVEEVETLAGISSYVSDYIVKGLKHDISDKSYFKYFEKRYSISQSCTRPEKTSHNLFNNQSIDEKILILEELNLIPVYNALVEDSFGDQFILFDKEQTK